MRRNVKLDPNWLVDAVREFDEDMAKKPPYEGYSPFRAARSTGESQPKPKEEL